MEQVECRFVNQKPLDTNEIIEKGHGRIETRKCEIITDLRFVNGRENWKSLKTIIKITATRDTGKKQEPEIRYYISSAMDDAKTDL
ncbi:hypothetical protein [Tannerella forsythia]|uniref:hypothetical protein n=1 Tax=Tannerella forsythia TaxID=28112 RepID=UPI00163B5F84|nr:hypothetical protein [Tannerella forsythia]